MKLRSYLVLSLRGFVPISILDQGTQADPISEEQKRDS